MKLTDHSIPDFKANADSNRTLIEQIDDGLTSFNERTYPDSAAAPLTLSFQSVDGRTVAGLLGRSAYGWMRVDILWVDESNRGKGLGAQLLAKAEQIAIERGCYGVHLDTHSFQAPEFYQRLGYEVFGELENYPGEHKHFYYRKTLASNP